jgi:predicted lactoylglutathione lyase
MKERMIRNTFFIPAALLVMLLLGACRTTDWVNPNVADPHKQDELFVEHSAQCRQEVDNTFADDPGNETARADLFEKCMKAKGWEEQDWW